jgi:serine/threonine protein kinase
MDCSFDLLWEWIARVAPKFNLAANSISVLYCDAAAGTPHHPQKAAARASPEAFGIRPPLETYISLMISKPPIIEDFGLPWASRTAPSIPDHEMISSIGRGSYGEVWLARSVVGTFRAVKIVYRATFETDRPFEREFSGMQMFEPISRSDEGLMAILQIGRNDADGYFYYVMELADDATDEFPASGLDLPPPPGRVGIDPAKYFPRTLASEKMRRGRLKAEECLRIGAALTLALDRLHQHGLIHRDIKPANIVFVKGVPKLADIGLVAEFSAASTYVGTEGFIPPEGPNSPQADIYSLGKVLYEVAMGKDRQDFPEPCSDLAETPDRKLLVELNAIILKACQPDRQHRYKSAREMHAELMLLLEGKSVRQRRARQKRVQVMACVGAVAGCLAVAALAFDRWLEYRVRSLQGQSTLINPALIGKIQPRPASAPHSSIDLSSFYNAPLTEAWYPGPENNTLASLPKGVQAFANTIFDVRGIVQLDGQEISSYGADKYPRELRGIAIGRWVKRLHFLEGAVSEVSDGKQIGAYEVSYRSGRTAEIPIRYGQDVRSLWQPTDSNGEVNQSTAVWTGVNPATERRKMALRLYQQSWENPSPGDEIIQIAFRSSRANSAPFLLALSCDEQQTAPQKKEPRVDVVKTLQGQATKFPRLAALGPNLSQLTALKLNEHPLQMGKTFYDGFRFSTPAGQFGDLVWAFAPSTNLHFKSWYILPVRGGMKAGFEDWFHGISPPGKTGGRTADLIVQFLSAKKLQPGTEYFIWFEFEDAQPVEIRAALRFVPGTQLDSNNAETLIRGLVPPGIAGAGELKFHRHYCLGAVR